MNPKFRPILGIGLDKVLERGPLQFPVLATPKLDGIRCITFDMADGPDRICLPMTRSLKPIPNLHVRMELGSMCPPGMDGELMTYDQDGHVRTFQQIQSDIMSEHGRPNFTYHVFDADFDPDPTVPYEARIIALRAGISDGYSIRPVLPVKIKTLDELEAYEQQCITRGHEGICFRLPSSKYKYGRSTPREQCLVKVKRFETAEALCVGLTEEMFNANPAEVSALGYKERSSHQAMMVGKGRLGALICQDGGLQFQIGSGFTFTQRENIWSAHQLGVRSPVGQWVQYKHQPHGRKDRPRTPIFLGFRDAMDMDATPAPEQKELL